MRSPRSRSRDDGGAATVLVLAVAGLLMFLTLALAGVAGLVAAQRGVQSAADLAALAGAEALAGAGDPCAAAGRAAGRNGAVLVACTIDGTDVRVRLSLRAPDLPGPVGAPAVTAEARAGPT